MTGLLSWMPLDVVQDLGWTLLQFLWQGFFLAALLALILPLCQSAEVRHNWALVTLAMMALSPVATFLALHDFGAGAVLTATPHTFASPALPWTSWLVAGWLAGIAGLSLHAVGGWFMVRALERQGTLAVPDDLLKRCNALRHRLAVATQVRFLLSRRVQVPVVVGWLRPVILIPLSALTGLSPQQLDALILHELAHIRRLDTITNILLVAVETILFYHPAIWWVGRQVRREREHACDDFAVSACGDAGLYVEALTSLETWKVGGFALAANGGTLRRRAERLLQGAVETRRFSLSGAAGLAILGLVIASTAMAAGDGSYPSSDRTPVTLHPIQGTHSLPPYPKDAAHRGEQGTVKLAVTIGTDGVVSRAAVAKTSGHPDLDSAALDYVKSQWRWQPPTRNGKPVTANTPVNVVFNLKKAPPASKP